VSMQIDLAGRAAVVTGAGSGIGEAIAKTLAEAGAAVAVADIDPGAAERVAKEIEAAGGTALPVTFDIADAGAVATGLAAVRDELGPVRIVVNNAATWVVKPFADTTQAEIDRIFAVTVYGTINVTQAALADLTAEPGGRVVNVVSDSARTGEPYMAAYASAKAALLGLTKSVAREVGRKGTTVNAVSPGTTQTPGGADFIEKAGGAEKLAKPYPLGRIGQPQDIANAVLFFASPLSDWITGQVLSVSGGYTMI
jgi:NAD(P)-dependent dehydrogenase (short-subunit alcohol dehydrogenase family)